MTASNLRLLLVITSCTILKIESASLGRGGVASDNQWHPDDQSLDQWIKYHGMGQDRWERVKMKLERLNTLEEPAVSEDTDSKPHFQDPQDTVLLTEKQIDILLEEENEQHDAQGEHTRKKRQLDSAHLVELWELPVPYKFSGEHTVSEQREIHRAMAHWGEHTCVRFEEIPTHESFSDNHLMFTREYTSCYTYVGKTDTIPQQINLMPSCFTQFGVLVHELGHILGLWHQQQRWDRDDYITVDYDNLGPYRMQYRKLSTENLNVGYDLGSVMHYAPYDGTKNGDRVIRSVDPLYQPNMGQRTGLSFNDAKIINFAYCSDVCSIPLAKPCEKGGYQDPNDCTKCRCPPGLGGVYCDQLEQSSSNCGGEILLNSTGVHYITSPNYPESYESFTNCNWKIKAPANHQVSFKFEGDFKVFNENQKQCFHWVEVKYKGLLESQGPRFCGTWKPYMTLLSDFDEILVIFRSDFQVPLETLRKGFQMKLWAKPNPNASTQTMSSTATTTAETSTQTTTTSSTFSTSTSATSTLPSSSVPTTSTQTTITDHPSVQTSPTVETSSLTTETGDENCLAVDLSFMLDSSGSVGFSNWIKTKEFVTKIIQRLSFTTVCSRVAVISFGNFAYEYCSLSDFAEGKTDVLTSVQSMKFKDEWTNTADALQTLTDDVYTKEGGNRDDVRDVSVLLTDGEGNVKPETTATAAKNVRDTGISILGIGVGSKVNKPELYNVTNNSQNVIFVEDYSDLVTDSFIDDMIRRISALAASAQFGTETTESSSLPSTSSSITTSTPSTTAPVTTTETSTATISTTESTTATSTTQKSSTTPASSAYSTSMTTEASVPHDSTTGDFVCSFEDSQLQGSMCGITQRQSDVFNWTRRSGSTPSEPTGPTQAFDGDYYVFIEASQPRQNGDNAVLELPAVLTSGTYCLKFNYHMFGFHVNTLNVYTENRDESVSPVWSRVGQQGDQWLQAVVTRDLNKGEKILFEGICGKEYSGDIALDNIRLERC